MTIEITLSLPCLLTLMSPDQNVKAKIKLISIFKIWDMQRIDNHIESRYTVIIFGRIR
ncbi:hypothetical protein MTBBW1_2760003 [Desulfamplus magnetovallimortis]|uniref:Uncharacterized protein n=1 Tax=Desulfamplus magnetovallimortis TaxID=1246637 RepID=A0A1W1HFJ5_9BACT|nr:hypothetical protein MTBBW1_2760003 [Desulfamplus magnetovallimortis]